MAQDLNPRKCASPQYPGTATLGYPGTRVEHLPRYRPGYPGTRVGIPTRVSDYPRYHFQSFIPISNVQRASWLTSSADE
eukprot:1564921-Rhodomonas_salina.1